MILCLLLALTPVEKAKSFAERFPLARTAIVEVRKATAGIRDVPLQKAVEAQLQAPWLPPEAWAYAHPEEAARLLAEAGLLDGTLVLPKPSRGHFASAPGGPCEDGHHGYPGGLAVHSWANLQHARALAEIYRRTYGVDLDDDTLVAASIWHDSVKASTLPWKEDGSCGPEGKIAHTAAHHVLGVASALLRHLPQKLVYVIASAHTAPSLGGEKAVCAYVEAAGILATGAKAACEAHPPLEALVTSFADADSPLTVASWQAYVARAPKGWARFDALLADGNDLHLWPR